MSPREANHNISPQLFCEANDRAREWRFFQAAAAPNEVRIMFKFITWMIDIHLLGIFFIKESHSQRLAQLIISGQLTDTK